MTHTAQPPIIRRAAEEDVPAMLAIYAPYVSRTAISFEYDVPTTDDFRQRFRHITARYPWLVATDDGGNILGYAYASAFHPRAAYQWDVETSIYVSLDSRHAGVGRQLYEALEWELRGQGIRNLYACLAYAEEPDPYLPADSLPFHRRLGFEPAAHFHRCGFKFGRHYDVIWLEKIIAETPQE